MQREDWLSLIAAYVEGRLGADTFKRRFLEAFEVVVAARTPVPAKVQALYFVVDAYGGDPMGRGHDVSDDAQLETAARAALFELGWMPPAPAEPAPEPVEAARETEPVGPPPPPPEPPRRPREIETLPPVEEEARQAEEQIRQMHHRVRTMARFGCVAALAWAAIGIGQFFAVSAQLQSITDWGPAPSTVAGLVLTFVPVVGSVTAFFGAKDVWGWSPWVAGAVFLALPLVAPTIGWWMRRGR